MKAMEPRISQLELDVASIRTRLAVIEATMATKDDLKMLEARLEAKFVTKEEFREFKAYVDATFATKADLLALEVRMKEWAIKAGLSFAALMLTTQIALFGIFYKLVAS